jgi:hypothetical protein
MANVQTIPKRRAIFFVIQNINAQIDVVLNGVMNDGNRVFVGFFTLKKPAISPYNLLNRVSRVIQKEGVGIHQRTIRQQRIPHNKGMKRLGVGKQVINNSIRNTNNNTDS